MNNKGKNILIVYVALAAAILLTFFMSLSIGSVSVDIFSKLDELGKQIIYEIRLPRAVLAAASGGALAISGYLLQTFFRNPIAGPYVLGISSGAKMTAAIMMILVTSAGHVVLSIEMIGASFAGAMLSTLVVLALSSRIRRMEVLLVAGIMMSYICSAITEFIVAFADESSIVNLHGWSQGSFSGAAFPSAAEMAVFAVFLSLIVFLLSKPIEAYRIGEVYARSMGINVRFFSLLIIVISSLLSAIVTAFAGPVSFIGVAVPFMLRKILKSSRPFHVIPALFMLGAVITMLCDLIARTATLPTELPLSTVTAIFGAPTVLVMMAGRRRENEH